MVFFCHPSPHFRSGEVVNGKGGYFITFKLMIPKLTNLHSNLNHTSPHFRSGEVVNDKGGYFITLKLMIPKLTSLHSNLSHTFCLKGAYHTITESLLMGSFRNFHAMLKLYKKCTFSFIY